MCGIAALSLAAPQDDASVLVDRMLDRLRHRGPEHKGIHREDQDRILLGHARLSINDLSDAGHQPLFNETGAICAIVNGEIYNYPDLRQELEARGHKFRSHSDSEVIVHLYEELGSACVEKLHGMFALVVYDSRTGELFCARDRIGKKPLVYAQTSSGTVIASEIPAVLEFPGVDRTIDEVALGIFLLRNFRHVPDPFTIYRGVKRLPPGHCMIIRQGSVTRLWRYFVPTFEPRIVTADEVLEHLDRAVRLRLLADVEIAGLLSGGIDSTAIIQSMQLQGAAPVSTYALGYGPDDSELIRARRAAKLLGCRHQEFYFDSNRHHDLMLDLWRIHGEPIALLPLAYAYDLCLRVHEDGHKVAMAGHGADELFYGYLGFQNMARLSRVLDTSFGQLSRPFASIGTSLFPHSSVMREAMVVAGHRPGRRKTALYRDEAARLLPELTTMRDPAASSKAIDEIFGTFMSSSVPRSYIDEAAIIGLMHENSHSVTIAGDLPAMAASIEVRCPFLDQDMVDLAWHTHYTLKVGSSRNRSELKLILKEALKDRLPQDLLYAPKQGFGFNIQEADVLSGPWKDKVDDALNEMGDLSGILSRSGVMSLRRDFSLNPTGRAATLILKLYSLAETIGR
ncbi:asparagine synthase (glutamine-hydrolyzing) [Rhodopseudomonas palustris]|uniref:asparagine synthase (glutamine-hydrolyzing) n=1 Tax=Rhodopseudomonas palustris TaxID=1076 RepID=UPI0022F0A7B3|nr:asparagine synthase (glutamine-hydrolyzing) [Rhodopseudomonas palustris]WBU31253.1 asparagine synthase (glutamine-hydrolyzing) [Rhodopseudomonas palustris]